MLTRQLFISLIFLVSTTMLTPYALAEKGKKNTKKADVKKVSREEHQVVKNWDNLHKKKTKKRKRIKKQFD